MPLDISKARIRGRRRGRASVLETELAELEVPRHRVVGVKPERVGRIIEKTEQYCSPGLRDQRLRGDAEDDIDFSRGPIADVLRTIERQGPRFMVDGHGLSMEYLFADATEADLR